MLRPLLTYIPYWGVCAVLGVAVGLVVFLLLNLVVPSEVLGYLGAFVAVKLVLDEVKAVFEGQHIALTRNTHR